MRKYLDSYRFTLLLFRCRFFLHRLCHCRCCRPVPRGQGAARHGCIGASTGIPGRCRYSASGGNAVDAAVAVGFALGVVEPNASGIGGGGLMLIWFADSGRVVFIDSREKAPAAASADMFELDENGRVIADERGFNPVVIGGRAVAVPGEVAGLLAALERYGSMSRQQVMQPAIDYAERGITVSSVLAGIIAENYEALATFPASEKIFLKDGFPEGGRGYRCVTPILRAPCV